MRDKIHLTEVTGDERLRLEEMTGELNCPMLFHRPKDNTLWADADELRAWRTTQADTEGKPK
jgi:hypothetical protein